MAIVCTNYKLNVVKLKRGTKPHDHYFRKPTNKKKSTCPKMRFLDNKRHMTGSHDKLVNMLVLDQKVINYEQPNEDNILKKDNTKTAGENAY